MSEFIKDTGETVDLNNRPDYSWRNKSGAGCVGTIHCDECGCIMAAQGSHCFCMGIYDCPRCGYHKLPMLHQRFPLKDNHFTNDNRVTITKKDFPDWVMI